MEEVFYYKNTSGHVQMVSGPGSQPITIPDGKFLEGRWFDRFTPLGKIERYTGPTPKPEDVIWSQTARRKKAVPVVDPTSVASVAAAAAVAPPTTVVAEPEPKKLTEEEILDLKKPDLLELAAKLGLDVKPTILKEDLQKLVLEAAK